MGLGKYVNSSTFSVAGYKWAIRFCPDGVNKESSDCISFYLEFKSNAGEAKTKFSCSKNTWGSACFIKRKIFEESCLKDDSFTIACDVVVIKVPSSEVVPPSDIHERLSHLLSSEIGTDVAFEVKGEVLHAHRCILVASSSVFEAELFGPMKEKNMKKIKILDIDASVFKAMIYFIYNDSLPEIEEKDSTTMVQNLLIAADRYALQRLILACEEKLGNSLDMSNVGTILALAEQHNLTRLGKACLEYFSAPKTLISAETSTEH
ncbi:BTB/POZ and MATH domain-containing protein 2 [Rhynchospora pubera]|uniref:BTB/POZ and MATH domain-containing protein 2 n=1 Tax=Rhynchospora pubera TaxID=906938 RepID=A0AAV8BRR9_9POAL|nr:BTB/POZ and MATH domain-containing protein 2 [Rhynchospora pubera]